ncbi:MAG: carboxypeptidase-like regulatory domain-containing protein [Bryobacteraceae bacterium]
MFSAGSENSGSRALPTGFATLAVRFIVFCCGACSFGASLTGIVQDQTNARISGAIALLQSETDPRQGQVRRTDNRGRFQFLNLADGRYKLELHMLGFASRSIRSIDVQGAEPTTMPVITLEIGPIPHCPTERGPLSVVDIRLVPVGLPGGSLAGSVQDTRGVAVAGVRVLLICNENTNCAESRTDDQGEFTFTGLAPGTYIVRVVHAGHYPVLERDLKVRPDLELVYRPIRIDKCRKGNCDPALRPKPPASGYSVICI